MRIRLFGARGLMLTAGLIAAILASPATATAVVDYVTIPGNQWLQGQGVDVYRYRQCVELPQSRLYPKFGWPRVYAAGNGGAAYIPEGSPGLIRYNPGSGYVPVPGDLIIENPYGVNVPYGHVVVVDYTDGNTIHAVQQNGPNARADYSYNGSFYSGSYGSVKCVMHAPQNGFTNPGSTPPQAHTNPIAPGDAGFTKGGTPAGWYGIGGGIYGTGLYSYGSNVGRDNWGRWTFDLSTLNGTGQYKVEAYVTSTHAGHAAVDYHINAHNGVQHVERNQNIYSNQWVDLGTYTLDAGSAWVELDDSTRLPWANSESDQICFDGMKLTYVAPVIQPAALSVTTPVTLSSGPYSVGKTITGSFTVKNTGGQSGTWAPLILALRGPSGENRDAVAASSVTLAPGQSQTVSFSKTLDLQGAWTGFVAGMFSGSTWQSPGGATVAFSVGPRVITSTVTRIAGDTRFDVAANLARKGWDPSGTKTWAGVTHVIVANGEDGREADPLTAAGLAGAYNCPVLLTKTATLPTATKTVIAEIAKKNPGVKIHIIGGTVAVPDARWSDIRRIAGVSTTKDRIAGATRYDTSSAIATRIVAVKGVAGIRAVILVAADNPAAFFDALAASPIAYAKTMPMLAVRKGSIPPSVAAALKSTALRNKPRFAASSSTYIGSSALSGATRLTTSSNRYTAAVDITRCAKTQSWASYKHTGLAAKLPDALTGGTYLGRVGGVMLFTDSTSAIQPTSKAAIFGNRSSIQNGWIVGGTSVVPTAQETSFRSLLQ